VNRTLSRRLAQLLWTAPLAWTLATGCQGPLDLTLVSPARLESDSPSDLPAPASSSTLGPGKPAPTQDRLAQPTLITTHTDWTPSAAPGAGEPSKRLLALAAARLDDRDPDTAALYLQRYLRRHPDATVVRLQLAELYFQQKRFEEARHQFDTALCDCDEMDPLPVRYVLHGHSRLVDLAAQSGDAFDEALHRGIGLVVLAEKRLEDSSPQEVAPILLYAKARAALHTASRARPTDARPHLHLIPAWLGLHQFANARTALARAQSLALTAPLSPADAARLARWGVELK
jgi:hypothetical protein